LLKAHDEAKSRTGLDLAIYGQEMDNATSALARMNMILHDCPTAEIWQDNTLSAPHFADKHGRLKTFDYVVANPPFSTKAWANGFDPGNDLYGRFTFGLPPAKNGDYAFLLHVLASLNSTGKGAVILPHGVLFRGGAEAAIRRRIVGHGFIKGLIGLPANLFYGTGIPACIVVLDKEGAAARASGKEGIFMLDASRGFIKDGNKNRLRAQDLHKIVDTFNRQLEVPRYARRVPLAEIEANDYNLNLPRYIDATEPEDLHDLEAHLRGGIPAADVDALHDYWRVFPTLRATLFEDERPGYLRLQAARRRHQARHPRPRRIRRLHHAHRRAVPGLAQRGPPAPGGAGPRRPRQGRHRRALRGPARALPRRPAARPLRRLPAPDGLLGRHPAGRRASDRAGGLAARARRRPQHRPDPACTADCALLRCGAGRDRRARGRARGAGRQIEEAEEEQSGEDSLFAEARNERGKLTAKGIKDRLKAIKSDPEAADERTALQAQLALIEAEAAAAKKVKDATRALDAQVRARYATLETETVQALVIDDKWLAALGDVLQGEVERVSQTLTGRVRELAERYAMPLPTLAAEVETLSARVEAHLRRMGVAWE
jgi:type I restriction enzyme M protein